MKKPFFYSLFIWLVLLLLPWTRPQTLLDWKSATLERLSATRPAWTPLDAPYHPETDIVLFASTTSASTTLTPETGTPKDVEVAGMSVAPQFANIARRTSDTDVLTWCARSASTPQKVADNLTTLSRRFPSHPDILAWACGAHLPLLTLDTRRPGPLTAPFVYWSVQAYYAPLYSGHKIEYNQGPQWMALVAQAHRGQKLEPSNGFWWWLEASALLGARRDSQVWKVLRAGRTKTTYEDHVPALVHALRRARLKTQNIIPVMFYLEKQATSFPFYSTWRQATRQICENIMSERFQDHHDTALSGGRDLMFMGRTLRLAKNDTTVLIGISLEAIALRNVLPPSAATLPLIPTPANIPAKAFANSPSGLLRYANVQGRSDIARQLITEWKAMTKSRAQQNAKIRALVTKSSG